MKRSRDSCASCLGSRATCTCGERNPLVAHQDQHLVVVHDYSRRLCPSRIVVSIYCTAQPADLSECNSGDHLRGGSEASRPSVVQKFLHPKGGTLVCQALNARANRECLNKQVCQRSNLGPQGRRRDLLRLNVGNFHAFQGL